jgi:hypothetical protein
MNRMTARQRYLYLSGKLYELAAEFTDSELVAMLREQSRDADATNATAHGIRALMELHRSPATARIEDDVGENGNQGQPPSQQASSLLALFEDRAAFPTVARMAAVVGIPARTKEARDRYVARVVRQVDAMSKQERSSFFGTLAKHFNRQPESFISKWARVIKDT